MRFSIRDLFWTALVVAMGLGWWRDYQRINEMRDKYDSATAEYHRTIVRLNEMYPLLKRAGELPLGPDIDIRREQQVQREWLEKIKARSSAIAPIQQSSP